ncbi:MAG: hypothetical protein ABI673_09130 [Novosphingobium sp.]
MSHNPTTFAGEGAGDHGIGWDDAATLHRKDDGGGVFHGFKALRHGTFADLVRFVALLPEAERSHYMIEKAGDRQYDAYEIAGLYGRPDMPPA